MQILWIRHGQTTGNAERRYVGRTDEGLTDDAKEDLKKKWMIKRTVSIDNSDMSVMHEKFIPDLIYCSPMMRCRQTAEVLFPGREIILWGGLQETDFGDFEYKNYEELKDDPVYQAWIDSGGHMAIPNGESGADFRERCCQAYKSCVQDARLKGADRIAIVCHGGTIMAVMERYGEPKKSFYEWQIANGGGLLTESFHIEENMIKEEQRREMGVYYGIREIGKW